jgi:hypothetical protein
MILGTATTVTAIFTAESFHQVTAITTIAITAIPITAPRVTCILTVTLTYLNLTTEAIHHFPWDRLLIWICTGMRMIPLDTTQITKLIPTSTRHMHTSRGLLYDILALATLPIM